MPKVLTIATRKVVAILEVMWDWRSMTTDAGYTEIAPRWFRINPRNLTGSRLYRWLGPKGKYYDELMVTNACKELVNNASGKGIPDKRWLSNNLRQLYPFDLLLVCGRVARETYNRRDAGGARVIELPHPAARNWTKEKMLLVQREIRHGCDQYTVIE